MKMLGIYELHYNINITVGNHDGSCSGEDCEDIDEEINEVSEICLSKNNSKFFNYLIRISPPEKLRSLLSLEKYFNFKVQVNYSGSGFCNPSPSGLLHEYMVNRSILQKVKFSKYVLSSKRVESDIVIFYINRLRNKIYNILFSLKHYKVVKDMRILIVNRFLMSL
jgi:hypothetical protein